MQINKYMFFCRYAEEFFAGVYGDVVLILYGFPVVLLYIIMALGKPNLLEHGVSKRGIS